MSASDDLAARLAELQLDVGEGPGWEAHSRQDVVLVPDLEDVDPARWPLFSHAVVPLDVNAVYSFPLAVGSLKIGTVDLYAGTANTLTAAAVADASVLAQSTSTGVLRYSVEHRHDVPGDDGAHSRREVHQATGMVIAQLGISAADALLLIRAHAFASGRSVRETAADITARRITLQP